METIQEILDSDKRYLVKHHLDAYDEFIKTGIRDIVISTGPILKECPGQCTINAYVGGEDASNITLEWFGETPSIETLRLKNLSYTRNIYADIEFVAVDHETQARDRWVEKSQLIGSLPVMIGSSLCVTRDSKIENRECPFDIGGYFLINGKEKVLVSQERGVLNRLFVEKSSKKEYSFTSYARCTTTTKRSPPKTLYMHVLSREIAHGRRHNAIVVDVPGIKSLSVPLFILFRALGIESDKDIIDMISQDSIEIRDFMRASVVDGNDIMTKDDSLEFLKSHVKFKTRESVEIALLDEFLPQVDDDFKAKARMLGLFIRRLVRTCLSKASTTDRDSYLHKRLSTSGYLLSELFQKYYKQFTLKMYIAIDNEFNVTLKSNYSFPFLDTFVTSTNRQKLFDYSQIQQGIEQSFRGSWGIMENSSYSAPELGIVQDLSRVSYMSFLSHLRRVATPFDDQAKVKGPHMLSATQWGILCPTETPDGRNVGLLNSLALLARVTHGGMATHDLITTLIKALDISMDETRGVLIFANEVLVGCSRRNRMELVSRIKDLREVGGLGQDAGISSIRDTDSIYVRTDAGRIVRPLFATSRDVIEYLDVEEIDSLCLIAMSRSLVQSTENKYTHYEVHPCALYSVYTNTIPFFNHNHATRNTFSCAQGKQAIGLHTTKFVDRIDTQAYFLHYPQRPIVETGVSRMLPGGGIMNNGENLIVAVACYSGYNMEDAVILNSSSVERGMFNVSILKSLFAEEKHDVDSSSTAYDIVIGNKDGQGLPKMNEYFEDGDIVVARTRFVDSFAERKAGDFLTQNSSQELDSKTQEDVHERDEANVAADQNHEGFVDGYYGISDDTRGFCKVRLRKSRLPEPGDKLASRHGQKGVVGVLMAPEDMPFTRDGLIPDLIVNPHAFPSRMTIGHLIESLAAKSAISSSRGEFDGTPFQSVDIKEIGDALVENSYERHGNEIMYNGFTGQEMPVEVFVGPTYYFRLKHMVADKILFREGGGAVVGLTGQPTKGRANDGGMRIGEMERDAILAHGMSGFLKESFGQRSDGKKALPTQDGDFSFVNSQNVVVGTTTSKITNTMCPTAFRLLSHELKAFHIDVKLSTI